MLEFVLPLLFGFLALYLISVRFSRTRRDGEPPLVNGWIPFLGKALEFRKNAHGFLAAHKEKHGDVFTVLIAGKYMTFIMNPLLYPYVIKHGKQLDFHEFSDQVAPVTFGYPPVRSGKFPGMDEHIQRSFRLLQGDNLDNLTESMMGNLMLVFHKDYLDGESEWRTESMYQFCNSVMFEATFLTMYGKPAHTNRHSGMVMLRQDFVKFDNMFPLLIARIPISLLGGTKTIRDKLINYFHPQRMSTWSNTSGFIKERAALFEQYDCMGDVDKAAHHFAILWASVGNTVPATFWAMYYLLTHPEALAVVREEIHCVLKVSGLEADHNRDVTFTREQLDSLLYLESAINESLRLSSASMNIRVAQEDFSLRLEGERSIGVRKGDIISLYPQSMHMDPEIYENPEMYKFDRYVEDGKEKTDFYKDGQKLKYYRMPFGSGSTKCPGRYFAVNEIKQFLSLLLLRFDMEVLEGQEPCSLDSSRAGLGILLPATDVQIHYRPRQAREEEGDLCIKEE
ncbi:cytochrome P450 7B1 isoform X1 [Oncorhynchus kisutch]|uniref:Cytochrome P450 family 7 subfamily B member 1 n=2 Tax=Oncorhynchus kisutch TaxID=8019 RepID=A0A8C7HK56_ONCKI|nr:cytochrome P450 7B1 isoform X1 [Oncorhynchus kisutch]